SRGREAPEQSDRTARGRRGVLPAARETRAWLLRGTQPARGARGAGRDHPAPGADAARLRGGPPSRRVPEGAGPRSRRSRDEAYRDEADAADRRGGRELPAGGLVEGLGRSDAGAVRGGFEFRRVPDPPPLRALVRGRRSPSRLAVARPDLRQESTAGPP